MTAGNVSTCLLLGLDFFAELLFVAIFLIVTFGESAGLDIGVFKGAPIKERDSDDKAGNDAGIEGGFYHRGSLAPLFFANYLSFCAVRLQGLLRAPFVCRKPIVNYAPSN